MAMNCLEKNTENLVNPTRGPSSIGRPIQTHSQATLSPIEMLETLTEW